MSTNTEHDNLAIIKSTYEGKDAAENGRNLAQHLASDARWTEANGFPLAGTYIGFEQIAEKVFSPLTTRWTNYRVTIDNYVSDGDTVVAYGTYYGTYNATGKHFEARVAHVWRLTKGDIISFEQFVDSVPVAQAMTP